MTNWARIRASARSYFPTSRTALISAACAASLAVAGQSRADVTWNAATDYDAGFIAGTNPNGAWTYGWSSTLTSPLTLYTQAHMLTGYPTGNPSFAAWNDPSELAGYTPLVYKNTGATYSDGNVDIPAGALILHGGGPSGDDYTHVVWTAPSAGEFALNVTFTNRQPIAYNYVDVLDNGATLFQNYLAFAGSFSFDTDLTLAAGDKIDFAVGISGTGLHGESTQLDATLTAMSAVPEPAALTMSVVGFAILAWGYARRDRSPR